MSTLSSRRQRVALRTALRFEPRYAWNLAAVNWLGIDWAVLLKLCARVLVPCASQAGRIAALDVLINNWDRFPLPIWQKNARYFAMSPEELSHAFRALRPLDGAAEASGPGVGSAGRAGGAGAASAGGLTVGGTEGGEVDAVAIDELLLECGANLGNVLLHAPSAAVESIDTCVIPQAAAGYAAKVGNLVDEIASAFESSKPSRSFQVSGAAQREPAAIPFQ